MHKSVVQYRSKIESDINKWVDNIFDEFWLNPAFAMTRNWRPTEIIGNEKEYKIEIELPRVKKEDIKVQAVDGNTLVVEATAKNFTFSRVFQYSDLDAENATVKLEDGVLVLTIPRVESKVKKLEVK